MVKQWTRKQLHELVALGKRKGYNKGEIAALAGINRSTLASWLNADSDHKITLTTRNALMWIEHVLTSLPDKLTR